MIHKTDVGAVCLDVADPAAVRHAYGKVARATGSDAPPVLVQPMVTGGLEVMVGVRHDPLFGSLVLLGSGGVQTGDPGGPHGASGTAHGPGRATDVAGAANRPAPHRLPR